MRLNEYDKASLTGGFNRGRACTVVVTNRGRKVSQEVRVHFTTEKIKNDMASTRDNIVSVVFDKN